MRSKTSASLPQWQCYDDDNDAELSHSSSLGFPNEEAERENLSFSTNPARPIQEMDLNDQEIRQFYNVPASMDPEEASYLLRTILSFKYYQRHTFAANHVRMQNFYALSTKHRSLLEPQFTEKLEAIDTAIEKNAIIARRIARLGEEMYLGGMEVPTKGPLVPKQKY